MPINFPTVNSRSKSPENSKRSLKLSITKHKTPKILLHSSIVSAKLSPQSKDSHEFAFPRKLTPTLESSQFLNKTNTFLNASKIKSHTNQRKNNQVLSNVNNFIAVINTLFSLAKCNQDRISALKIVSIFISLKYASNVDSLIQVFKDITGNHSVNTISFNRNELLAICIDSKVDKMFKALQKTMKNAIFLPKKFIFDNLQVFVNNWWESLNKSKKGYATLEEVCKFLMEVEVLENTQNGIKYFSKASQKITYKEFSVLFSRAFLKCLLSEMIEIIERINFTCISPDIAINAQRRRVIIDSLKGQNNVLQSLETCNSYNNNMIQL